MLTRSATRKLTRIFLRLHQLFLQNRNALSIPPYMSTLETVIPC